VKKIEKCKGLGENGQRERGLDKNGIKAVKGSGLDLDRRIG